LNDTEGLLAMKLTSCCMILSLILVLFSQTGCIDNDSSDPSRRNPFGLSIELYDIEFKKSLNLGYPETLESTMTYIHDLGVKWIRPSIFWGDVETTENVYTLGWLDSIAVTLYQENLSAIWTLYPYNTWDYPKRDPPSDLPYNEEAYQRFVQIVVERYDGDLDFGCSLAKGIAQPSLETIQAIQRNPWNTWEVMNEPDLEGFFMPSNEKNRAEDYFHILSLSYDAVKAAGEENQVLIGGLAALHHNRSKMTFASSKNLQDFIPYIQQESNRIFDTLNIHCYGPFHDRFSQSVFIDRIHYFQDIIGQEKKIVITETGSSSMQPIGDDPSTIINADENYSEKTQAQDLIKRYVLSLASNVEPILFYSLIDAPPICPQAPKACEILRWGGHCGLLHNNGTKKLSYYTYKLLVDYFEDCEWDTITRTYATDNVYAYRFMKNQSACYIVWWDYFNDSRINEETISIVMPIDLDGTIRITESVPEYETGFQLAASLQQYPDFFKKNEAEIDNGQIALTLGYSPLYIT